MNVRREPVIVAGTIVGLVEAAIVMSVALGWLDLDNEQIAAVMAFTAALVAVLAPLVGAVWSRGRVTPTNSPRDDTGRRLVPDVRQ